MLTRHAQPQVRSSHGRHYVVLIADMPSRIAPEAFHPPPLGDPAAESPSVVDGDNLRVCCAVRHVIPPSPGAGPTDRKPWGSRSREPVTGSATAAEAQEDRDHRIASYNLVSAGRSREGAKDTAASANLPPFSSRWDH